jgi:hypothetical protein
MVLPVSQGHVFSPLTLQIIRIICDGRGTHFVLLEKKLRFNLPSSLQVFSGPGNFISALLT